MALVVDIETVGREPEEIPPRALELLFRSLERHVQRETPQDLEARRRELMGRFGLDPTTGFIVCIGLLDTETREEKALYPADEKQLLTAFWEWLGERRPESFVTFNGKSFDFPYINIRSAILEIPPSMALPLRPYTTRPHFDVREVLSSGDRHRRGSLDYFCAVFGIASPKEQMNGAEVGTAYRQGRLKDIARYCLADCRATAALYERLRPYYESARD